MNINLEEVVTRANIWKIAKSLVDPIIEQHGLEEVKLPQPSFGVSGGSISKVDQHILKVLNVADWLIIGE